jgi:hypothetical protein
MNSDAAVDEIKPVGFRAVTHKKSPESAAVEAAVSASQPATATRKDILLLIAMQLLQLETGFCLLREHRLPSPDLRLVALVLFGLSTCVLEQLAKNGLHVGSWIGWVFDRVLGSRRL